MCFSSSSTLVPLECATVLLLSQNSILDNTTNGTTLKPNGFLVALEAIKTT